MDDDTKAEHQSMADLMRAYGAKLNNDALKARRRAKAKEKATPKVYRDSEEGSYLMFRSPHIYLWQELKAHQSKGHRYACLFCGHEWSPETWIQDPDQLHEMLRVPPNYATIPPQAPWVSIILNPDSVEGRRVVKVVNGPERRVYLACEDCLKAHQEDPEAHPPAHRLEAIWYIMPPEYGQGG